MFGAVLLMLAENLSRVIKFEFSWYNNVSNEHKVLAFAKKLLGFYPHLLHIIFSGKIALCIGMPVFYKSENMMPQNFCITKGTGGPFLDCMHGIFIHVHIFNTLFIKLDKPSNIFTSLLC